jgi:chromate transporter
MNQRPVSGIFLTFLRLGCTSFGGPVAHLGYYREELVRRRQWLDETCFAEIVAFCQMIPGPGSSQTGFTIGLVLAGWRGALAAFTAFTLPSALLMLGFAMSQSALSGPLSQRAIHGLQLVAVAVVAQAVIGMRKTLAPDLKRGAIALVAAGIVLSASWSGSQVAAIAFGGLAGWLLLQDPAQAGRGFTLAIPKRAGVIALSVFAVLLAVPLGVFGDIYRTGALVFGGGHVVLPLLQSVTVSKGLVDEKTFLAGYGAVQAMPGPMFSFAAYLGAMLKRPPNGITGGALALIALFLPGLLLVAGLLPFWAELRKRGWLRKALAGVNAGVVGILAAALYKPVWTGSVHTARDLALALAAFLALTVAKLPPWSVVIAVGTVSLVLS